MSFSFLSGKLYYLRYREVETIQINTRFSKGFRETIENLIRISCLRPLSENEVDLYSSGCSLQAFYNSTNGFPDLIDWQTADINMTGAKVNRWQFHQCFTHSFYARRSWKRKKIQLSHQSLFTLSGSVGVKAVCRTLMKLSPGLTFTNVLCSAL